MSFDSFYAENVANFFLPCSRDVYRRISSAEKPLKWQAVRQKKNREWGTEEKISNEIVINFNYRIQGAWATIFFFNSWLMFLFEKKWNAQF